MEKEESEEESEEESSDESDEEENSEEENTEKDNKMKDKSEDEEDEEDDDESGEGSDDSEEEEEEKVDKKKKKEDDGELLKINLNPVQFCISDLLHLAKLKIFLRELCYESIIILLLNYNEEELDEESLKLLSDHLSVNLTEYTPEMYALSLNLQKNYSVCVLFLFFGT